MQLSTVQPVFKLELNHKVTPEVVTIAKYDGTHPCLTASAGYDKVNTSTYTLATYSNHGIPVPRKGKRMQT